MSINLKQFTKVNESLTIYRYSNGWMFEIGGRNNDGDYKTAKIICKEEHELISLLKEYNTMEVDN